MMATLSSFRQLNPLRIFKPGYKYQALPADNNAPSPFSPYLERLPPWLNSDRIRKSGRLSLGRVLAILVTIILAVTLLATVGRKAAVRIQEAIEDEPRPYIWMHFYKMPSYFNGIRTLIPYSEYTPANRYNESIPPHLLTNQTAKQYSEYPAFDPTTFNPYSNLDSSIQTCYLDLSEMQPVPDIFAYPGIPQDLPAPQYGSYDALGLEQNMCFDRFGRLGPYGYGMNESVGGLIKQEETEHVGSEKIYDRLNGIDMANVDWGNAQKRCYEKNKALFDQSAVSGKKKSRQAFVLRVWTGYNFGPHQILTLRAMISELSLRSGGEYDVHFLLHVKDNNIPIWADEETYKQVLESNLPQEFWNMATLWSEAQMKFLYPGAFDKNWAGMVASNIHGVYRSPHFALQWFAKQHPEYDFFWNWEMDLRFTGHYYEFLDKIDSWAAAQPRKGMWERGSRFYVPNKHGNYHEFTKFIEDETLAEDVPNNNVERDGPIPVWGPVSFANTSFLPRPEENIPPTTYEEDAYSWGVTEPADFLSFNPLFQPATTNWVFRNDITGYDLGLPEPPRRAAIITVGRLSKKLLNTMHEEVFKEGHTAFPEMFPATVALHHGYKALYIPHPVYFENDWKTEDMDQTFNHPTEDTASPFGWGEHNMLGGTFYYNSRFAQDLWRKWLGSGRKEEEEQGTGRLCLRSMLFHPIKEE